MIRRPVSRRAARQALALLAAGFWAAGAAMPATAGTSSVLTDHAAAATALTGAQIANRIRSELALEGLSGTPMLGAERLFPPCPGPLSVSPHGSSGWATVRVACAKNVPGWPLFVRTRTESGQQPRSLPIAKAETDPAQPPYAGLVVHLATSLRAGEVLDAQDVTLAPSVQSLSTGLFSDLNDVIGRRLLVPLGEGQPLRARHLEIDWTLRAGAPVQIVNRIGGIEIVTEGRALADAQTGDLIEVENTASGQVLGAIVLSTEKVRPVAKIPSQRVVADSVRRVPWLMH